MPKKQFELPPNNNPPFCNGKILRKFLKIARFRHCERSEAIQNIDYQWIASGYRPRNDVAGGFLEVPINNNINKKKNYLNRI
jgi:hypothetical protein